MNRFSMLRDIFFKQFVHFSLNRATVSRLHQIGVLVGQHLAKGGRKVAHKEGAVLENKNENYFTVGAQDPILY